MEEKKKKKKKKKKRFMSPNLNYRHGFQPHASIEWWKGRIRE